MNVRRLLTEEGTWALIFFYKHFLNCSAEMRFLRRTAGCTRWDHKRNGHFNRITNLTYQNSYVSTGKI
jgi:hypothetical protein